jgi:hypothetical protein
MNDSAAASPIERSVPVAKHGQNAGYPQTACPEIGSSSRFIRTELQFALSEPRGSDVEAGRTADAPAVIAFFQFRHLDCFRLPPSGRQPRSRVFCPPDLGAVIAAAAISWATCRTAAARMSS